MTLTRITQFVPGVMVPPLTVIEPAPAAGTGLKTSPPQPDTTVAPAGLPTTIFVGKVSVVEKFVRVASAGALIVRVITELLPSFTGLVP